MERVITWSFKENFIENLAQFLIENFAGKDNDFSRVLCVFGGKRPGLFLKQRLSQKIKKSFYPPVIYSMDEFIEYIVKYPFKIFNSEGETVEGKSLVFKKISEIDACYFIYIITQEVAGEILRGQRQFSEFLPWAREIISFIEQMDLENIPNEALAHIQKSAEIGYEVPQSINLLLQNIINIRNKYHSFLRKNNVYSRGLMYLDATKIVPYREFEEFETIIFCNFFYLHTTERDIFKEIYKKKKGIFIFQNSDDKWSVLEENAKYLGFKIPSCRGHPQYKLSIYQGFDLHSQVCIVNYILNNEIKSNEVKNKENTVIVVPSSEAIIPLLTEITSQGKEFNVSLGYPFRKSSLFTLFATLLKVQESRRKDGKYYAHDYLKLLRHPLIKNLKIFHSSAVTRVIVHKIEEVLKGILPGSINGSLFLNLEEIENEEKIYWYALETLQNMNIYVKVEECKTVLTQIHNLLFQKWEDLVNFSEFADNLEYLLNTLVEKSKLIKFPFNLKFVEKLYLIKEQLKSSLFCKERFTSREMWEVFLHHLEGEMIPFIGSPLKGTQILGLFETRSLSFDNVIVMDVNESLLPRLKIYEPLIPREVMLNLGLNRLEKEEEIQRYQFMRLISGAKKVYLIYQQTQEKERSRFIEELLWEKQKATNKLEVTTIPKVSFLLKISSHHKEVKKTQEMVDFLKQQVYSATSIDTYVDCPLKFFYRYVLGLKERENLLGELETSYLGRFLHELLRDTMERFKGKRPVIDAQFKKYFFKELEERFEKKIASRMKSDSFLLKKIITTRMERFLECEKRRNVARIICLEEPGYGRLNFSPGTIEISYVVDRIDELEDGSIVIIDYKTGSTNMIPKELRELENIKMERCFLRENIGSFQLPLYYHFISQKFPALEINAELYNLRTMERELFIKNPHPSYKEKVIAICINALQNLFGELFNPEIPFQPDDDAQKCKFCPFTSFC